MSSIGCTRPLIRAETQKSYRNQKGGLSYKAEIHGIDLSKYSETIKMWENLSKGQKYRKFDVINCGSCIGCRLNYARDKAVQLSLENMNPEYQENEKWFVTLTYNNDHLPSHAYMNEETGEWLEGYSINPKDIQDFWKRVRKYVKKVCKKEGRQEPKIRYLDCCEYGKSTYRPHAHFIVFGLPLHEELFIKLGNNTQGDPLWTSPELQKLWSEWDEKNKQHIPIGNVQIGRVTFKSISYVARYTLKKVNKGNDDWWYMSQGMKPEWKSQSTDIGKWYYDLHKEEIYELDIVPVQDNKGNFCKPPLAFDRWYEKENPENFRKVKAKRRKLAKDSILQKELQTDMSFSEMMNSLELKLSDFKDLRRDI